MIIFGRQQVYLDNYLSEDSLLFIDKRHCLDIQTSLPKKITDMRTSRVIFLEMLSVPWMKQLFSMTVFQMIGPPSVVLDDLVGTFPIGA